MPTNNYKPFATGGAANVISQGAWEALAALTNGFTSGVAQSAQLNKAWRQSSVMAAVVGQFINDYGALDALDDGNVANLVRDLARSMQAGKFSYVVATGTANTWVVAPTPAVAAYAAGRVLWVKAPATNTNTTVNANISGLGDRRIKKADGADPAVGDLVVNRWYPTIDDGTNICVVSALPSDMVASTSVVGRTQIFTASGTFTVPAGVTSVEVEAWGGGGGGGASGDGVGNIAGTAGCGGGAGGYGYKRISGLTPLSTIAVTVGSGGTGVANAAVTGNAGGATSFGAHMTCNGGAGGASGRNYLTQGGAGGAVTGADFGIEGGRGGTGGAQSTFAAEYVLHIFNKGGMPARALGNWDSFGTGANGKGYGFGGVGASGGSAAAGGSGAPGLLIVRW